MSEKNTDLLQSPADAFDPAPAPDPRAVATRARRHRGVQRAGGLGVAVLALIATVVVSMHAAPPRRQEPITATPGITADELAGYRWSDLPAAPIEPRSQAVLGWTGSEMVVWGGVTHDSRILPDGAAFDPARSVWRRIAGPSGVPPRYGATPLWTGSELLVVGGLTGPSAAAGGMAPAGRGGAYDPAADRWRPLAPGPADGERLLAAVWTGREAIVITSARSVAAYDPAIDRWRALPSIPEPASRELEVVVPAWTGRQLLAWALSAHSDISPTTGSGTLSSGIDLFSLDVATGEWTVRPGHGERPVGIRAAHWTGDSVVLPAAGPWRGYSSGPVPRDLYGLRYSPEADTYTALAHGPLDDGAPEAYWTGAALFALSHTFISGGTESMDDGDTAAWDPSADRWTRLKRAPAGVTYETPLLWTGKEFLSYGAQPSRFGR